jgi:hypothetical protein
MQINAGIPENIAIALVIKFLEGFKMQGVTSLHIQAKIA